MMNITAGFHDINTPKQLAVVFLQHMSRWDWENIFSKEDVNINIYLPFSSSEFVARNGGKDRIQDFLREIAVTAFKPEKDCKVNLLFK